MQGGAQRPATGLNREQFATALGITWGNADGIYCGRECPSVLTLARIAGVIGSKPPELLEGVEGVPPAGDPAELLKAAKGRGPPTRRIALGGLGNGRCAQKASGGAGKKAKAPKAKGGRPRPRKTPKRTSKKVKAAKSAKPGR